MAKIVKKFNLGKKQYIVYNTGSKVVLFNNKSTKANTYLMIAIDKGKRYHYGIYEIKNGSKLTLVFIFYDKKGLLSRKPKVIEVTVNAKSLKEVLDKVNEHENIVKSMLSEITLKIDYQKSFWEKVFDPNRWALGATILSAAIPFFFFLYYVYKMLEIKVNEVQAYNIEDQINRELYEGKPFSALEDYATLIMAIESLLKEDTINGVLVYGPPGTGKTYAVRRVLYDNNANVAYYKGGTVTLTDFVKVLYQNRKGKVIVLDDFDTALKDEDFINILKAATDSYPKRVISIPRSMEVTGEGGMIEDIPEKFVFTSKVILITNKGKKEIPAALRSRMYSIEVNFTNDKLLEIIKKSIDVIKPEMSRDVKLNILAKLKEIIHKCKSKDVRVDFRTYNMALDLYNVYKDEWTKVIKDILC